MFGLFKNDPSKKLKDEQAKLMEKAMQAQRNGDIEGYANLVAKADEIEKKIEEIEREKNAL